MRMSNRMVIATFAALAAIVVVGALLWKDRRDLADDRTYINQLVQQNGQLAQRQLEQQAEIEQLGRRLDGVQEFIHILKQTPDDTSSRLLENQKDLERRLMDYQAIMYQKTGDIDGRIGELQGRVSNLEARR